MLATHPLFSALQLRIEAIFKDAANIVHQIQRTATLAQNMTYTIYLELKPP